jgi:hypothetical protein
MEGAVNAAGAYAVPPGAGLGPGQSIQVRAAG